MVCQIEEQTKRNFSRLDLALHFKMKVSSIFGLSSDRLQSIGAPMLVREETIEKKKSSFNASSFYVSTCPFLKFYSYTSYTTNRAH